MSLDYPDNWGPVVETITNSNGDQMSPEVDALFQWITGRFQSPARIRMAVWTDLINPQYLRAYMLAHVTPAPPPLWWAVLQAYCNMPVNGGVFNIRPLITRHESPLVMEFTRRLVAYLHPAPYFDSITEQTNVLVAFYRPPVSGDWL